MFKNYFKSALLFVKRYKVFAEISALGLNITGNTTYYIVFRN